MFNTPLRDIFFNMNLEIQMDYSVSAVSAEYLTTLDILNTDPKVETFPWFYIYLNHQ